jgi:hypothetical protein
MELEPDSRLCCRFQEYGILGTSMKNRTKTSKQVVDQTTEFLEKRPELAEAMRLFEVSSKQYRMATEATNFSTEVSANPKLGVLQGSYFNS